MSGVVNRVYSFMFLVVIVNAAAIGCRDKNSDKPAYGLEKQTIRRSLNAVNLPSKLWDLLAQGVGNEQTEFVPLRVTLIEKTPGTLGGHNHEITFGQGGGEIDLKDYVTGPGSFWLNAELAIADGTADAPVKVFYLPRAKERALDGLTFGAGCRRYLDITSYVTRAAKKKGLLGIVAGQRYVSTLSGVFFFSQRQGDRLQVAQVTVFDSRYPALLCPREPAAL